MSNEDLFGLHKKYIEEFSHRRDQRIPSGYGVSDAEKQVRLFDWTHEHPEYLVPSDATRNIRRERTRIKNYLDREFEISPSYKNYLESLSKLPTVSDMSERCRLAVNIPSYQEGKRIYEVLDEYTRQIDDNGVELDPDIWEINIFDDTTLDVDFDNSRAEVERFLKDFGSKRNLPPINFISVKVSKPFNTIGHARKVLSDLALYRSLQRTSQLGPLYFESEDMDLDRVDPHTVYNAITMLDEHPELDYIKGIEDRNPDVMKENDYLFFRNRVWDFIMVLLRSKKYQDFSDPNFSFGWNRMVSGGWCTAYSAEAYAISGGHDPFAITGEDTGLGENLSVFRSEDGNPNLEIGAHVRTRSDSSPRRFLVEMITGKTAYTAVNFKDHEIDRVIRDWTIQDLLEHPKVQVLSRINPENIIFFNKILLKQVKRARDKVPQAEFPMFVRRLFMMLGFRPEDYQLTMDDESPFIIYNWQRVAYYLEEYRSRHPRNRFKGERTKYRNE